MAELQKSIREAVRRFRLWFKTLLVLVLAAVTVLSSVFTVPPDSKAVVKRFGVYTRTVEPGIHLKLPWGMETAEKVPVKRIQKEEFGFRTLKAGIRTEYVGVENLKRTNPARLREILQEARQYTNLTEEGTLSRQVERLFQSEYQMLTGDLNVVDVEFVVQYRIKDPVAYLFNVREKRKTLRDICQAAMRLIIGDGSVDEAITIGRADTQSKALEKIQTVLDDYGCGIDVVAVKLQSVNPPRKVRPSFNEVNEAKQEKERLINEAWQEYNKVVPKAKGDAERTVKEAEAYAVERVNQAKGDAARFEKLLAEYQKAEDITRRRLYIEMLSKVLPELDTRWIVEQKGAEGGILLKLDMGGGPNAR